MRDSLPSDGSCHPLRAAAPVTTSRFFNVLNHPVLFLNPNGRNNGLFQYVASTRSFVVNRAVTGIDPNNTGQYGNYAGRMFRLGLRVQF